ncbi:MAG: helix-turn-helix transcriptional regulator [Hylemonella sp.]|nr:helix-turn-helix transcriptional regulator [Hylemonella sp.]MDP1938095.1 helix-turn-helix transcriptional regulator [Hylemonella sp.]
MQAPTENLSGIPDRLREVIAKTGLSQAKFAALIDVELQKLKDVLRGHIRPPADLVQKVIERCQVDAMWFLSGRELDIGALTPLEKILIENLRSLSDEERTVMTRSIAQLANERAKKS